ncbi:MAG: MBL fold metallo-hydrolase [Clostridia bacterium]|nr:MBL fold metallo-hydrolase [Clostridia bacterium]
MNLTNEYRIVPEVSCRWLTIACFEVKVGDFHIVIDPCIGASKAVPYGAEVIEKTDLILLSHGHWDHTTDLEVLQKQQDCPLLCGELLAPALIRALDCNPASVYPMTPDLEQDFGPVKVKALFARHRSQKTTISKLTEALNTRVWNDTEDKRECNFIGNLEYRNYLITTASGMKIMFWGSDATTAQQAIIRREQPDIVFMQYTGHTPEELAAMAAVGNVKVIIPHHMDLSHPKEYWLPRVEKLDEVIKKTVPGCTVITPEYLKWYHFGMGMYAD